MRLNPVKQRAIELGLPTYEWSKDKAVLSSKTFAAMQPDVFVVVSFGFLFPKSVLEIPKAGCVNAHASLLPAYRGASPIQSALLAGETETGISIMRLTEGMDEGAVLFRKKVLIGPAEGFVSLEKKLAELSASAVEEALILMAQGRAVWMPQDPKSATYCGKIKKEDGRIDWHLSAESLCRRVRAYEAWPGCYAQWQEKRLIIRKAMPKTVAGAVHAGEVMTVEDDSVVVGTGKGALVLQTVQLEGRRSMSAAEFARGARVVPGSILE